MGQIHSTRCDCGQSASVKIGGGMLNFKHDSRFPFYCEACGLVSVNVQAEKLECPHCYSDQVLEYGKPPISIRVEGDNHPRFEWDNYKAYWKGNLCPDCKQHTMRFGPTEIMFD